MRFLIMNGAGNRFAVFDSRQQPDFALYDGKVKAICKPGSQVMGPKGADQLIILRAPKSNDADIFMEIWNREGGQVNACGNATRTTAWLYMRDEGVDVCRVQTNDAILHCRAAGEKRIAVDMGPPKLEWQQIPLKEAMHTHHIDVKLGPIDDPVLSNPGAVSMGNPHCVFFVDDFTTVKPELAGPMIEYHPLFPEQVNVGFAKILPPDDNGMNRIRLKVWERGAGLTLACGTGACAALVAAHRQKRTGRKAIVQVDGGELLIEWREADDHVIMTGPVELEMEGTF